MIDYIDDGNIVNIYLCTIHDEIVQVSAMNSIFIAYCHRWEFNLQRIADINGSFR